jgi:hypothetical protein
VLGSVVVQKVGALGAVGRVALVKFEKQPDLAVLVVPELVKTQE